MLSALLYGGLNMTDPQGEKYTACHWDRIMQNCIKLIGAGMYVVKGIRLTLTPEIKGHTEAGLIEGKCPGGTHRQTNSWHHPGGEAGLSTASYLWGSLGPCAAVARHSASSVLL